MTLHSFGVQATTFKVPVVVSWDNYDGAAGQSGPVTSLHPDTADPTSGIRD